MRLERLSSGAPRKTATIDPPPTGVSTKTDDAKNVGKKRRKKARRSPGGSLVCTSFQTHKYAGKRFREQVKQMSKLTTPALHATIAKQKVVLKKAAIVYSEIKAIEKPTMRDQMRATRARMEAVEAKQTILAANFVLRNRLTMNIGDRYTKLTDAAKDVVWGAKMGAAVASAGAAVAGAVGVRQSP